MQTPDGLIKALHAFLFAEIDFLKKTVYIGKFS